MTSWEETAKVKKLEKINGDKEEVHNINDKIALANVNEYTKIKN